MTALRRFASTLASAILLLVLLLMSAYANSDTAIYTWDISATEEDSVSASLYEISQDVYRIEISGCGKMKNFSSSDMPPWFEYADCISFARIGAEVENLGRFTFNNCFNLEKIIIEGVSLILPADIFPIPDETEICAHVNSSVKEYLSINNPERFSILCQFDNSNAK